MTLDFSAAMRRALQLTRAQNVIEATRVIQRAVTGGGAAAPTVEEALASARLLGPARDVAGTADAVEPPLQRTRTASASDAAAERRPSGRARRPLGEVV